MTQSAKITSRQDALNSYHVTEEQLSKVQAIQDGATGKWFFIAESMSQPGVEYKVVYNAELKALQCLPFNGGPVCKASESGHGCWHKRASLASAAIYRLEQKRLAALEETRKVEAVRPTEEVSEQATIERLIRQGWSRSDAERIVYSKGQAKNPRGNTLNRNPEVRRDEQGRLLR